MASQGITCAVNQGITMGCNYGSKDLPQENGL